MSSSVDAGVSYQIRELRKQRHWNQTELAERVGMQQERVSTLENPRHPPTLSTLKKIASAFDVGLTVRFVALSDVVKHELNLQSESFEVLSYNEEPYFKELPDQETVRKLVTQDSGLGTVQGTPSIDMFGQSSTSVPTPSLGDQDESHASTTPIDTWQRRTIS